MENLDALREHIINLLTKAEAHVDVRSELESFPAKLRGRKPPSAPHTPWQLLEHMRIAQWDILRFSVDANHASPKWPEGYWPEIDTPPNEKAWKESVRQFLADLDAICELVRDPSARSVCTHPSWHRTDAAARSPAAGRPQCLPPGATSDGAQEPGKRFDYRLSCSSS